MNKKLLKTFLVAVGLAAGVNGAWAQDYVTITTNAEDPTKQDVTYSFHDESRVNTAGVTIDDSQDPLASVYDGSDYMSLYACTTDGLERIAFNAAQGVSYGNNAWWWRTNNSKNSTQYGLQLRLKSNNNIVWGGIAILNLKEGDAVVINGLALDETKFTFPGASSVNGLEQEPANKQEGEADYTVTWTENNISINVTKAGYVASYVKGDNNTYIYNIIITETKPAISAPVGSITSVNGQERTVRLSTSTADAKIYYTTDNSTPTTDDNLYDDSKGIVIAKTTTINAIAVAGGETSDVYSETFEAGTEISLMQPTITLASISVGFDKTYTVSCDNSDVLLQPQATLSYVFTPVGGTPQAAVPLENGGTINSTAAGTYIVTATAPGYTSSTVTIENTVPYELVNEYNFSEMTEEEFSNSELWTRGTDTDSRWGWSDAEPGIKFELNDPATNAATVFEGLTLFTNKVPTIYVGYGLMASYENGNYGVLSLTDAQEGQYAIYTYLNNYGRSTLVTVQEATESYSLYRYSDMLQSIKVYAPATDINVTIGEAGLATYTPSVALDFTNATDIAAYKASVSGDVVNLTRVNTVAAGEGVLIRSLNGGAASEDIAVATEAVEKAADNMFIGTLTDIEALASEADGFANYILNDGEMGLGFYQANDQKVAAGKAYLQVPAASANRIMFFSLDGETTGISNVEVEAEQGEKVYYNLNGQRIDTPDKGLYIVNGKKVIIK